MGKKPLVGLISACGIGILLSGCNCPCNKQNTRQPVYTGGKADSSVGLMSRQHHNSSSSAGAPVVGDPYSGSSISSGVPLSSNTTPYSSTSTGAGGWSGGMSSNTGAGRPVPLPSGSVGSGMGLSVNSSTPNSNYNSSSSMGAYNSSSSMGAYNASSSMGAYNASSSMGAYNASPTPGVGLASSSASAVNSNTSGSSLIQRAGYSTPPTLGQSVTTSSSATGVKTADLRYRGSSNSSSTTSVPSPPYPSSWDNRSLNKSASTTAANPTSALTGSVTQPYSSAMQSYTGGTQPYSAPSTTTTSAGITGTTLPSAVSLQGPPH